MNLKKMLADQQAKMQALVGEVETIVNGAQNRPLTAAESARIDAINGTANSKGELDAGHDEIDRLQKMLAQNQRVLDRCIPLLNEQIRRNGGNVDPQQPSMTNQFGDGIHCLSRDQSVAAIHGSERVPNGIGQLIRARVCGIGRGTSEAVRNAMSTGSDMAGGFLVPDILSGDLIDLARAKSVLVGLGMQTLICTGSTTTIAKVVAQPTPEVKTEMSSFTAQDFTLSGVTLVPRTVGVYLECSRELVQDAPNFVVLIEDQLSKTLATYVDRYGLVGFGGGSLGIAGDTNISETTSSGAITWPKVAAASTNVKVANHTPSGCVLYPTMNDALLDQASGDGTNSAKLWQSAPPSLAGVTFVDSTNMTSTKLTVGDFSKYAMGLWSGFQIEVSSTAGTMMQKHGVAIKITARMDFALLDSSAFYRLTGLTVS